MKSKAAKKSKGMSQATKDKIRKTMQKNYRNNPNHPWKLRGKKSKKTSKPKPAPVKVQKKEVKKAAPKKVAPKASPQPEEEDI